MAAKRRAGATLAVVASLALAGRAAAAPPVAPDRYDLLATAARAADRDGRTDEAIRGWVTAAAQAAVLPAGDARRREPDAALAALYVRTNQHARAEPRFARALAALPEADRPGGEAVALLDGLASCQLHLGRSAAAEATARRAVRAHEAAKGDVPAATVTLGRALTAGRKYDEAAEVLARAVALATGRDGATSAAVAAATAAAGELAEARGDFAAAEAAYAEVLRIQQEVRGDDDAATAAALDALGRCHVRRGDAAGGIALLERSVRTYTLALGPLDPRQAGAVSDLAVALHASRRNDEAEALHRRAIAMREAQYGGRDAPRAAAAHALLANQYADTGRLNDAEAIYKWALPAVLRENEVDSPLVTGILNRYAALLRKTGRAGQVEPLRARARQLRAAHAGPAAVTTSAE